MSVVKDNGPLGALGAGIDPGGGQGVGTAGVEAVGTPHVAPLSREGRVRVAVGAEDHALLGREEKTQIL